MPPIRRPQIFIAPGESPDLLEMVRLQVDVEEAERLDGIRPGNRPAVLFLSRGLLRGLGPAEWEALPYHVVVVAGDSQSRGEAERAGRLFLSMEDFRGDRRSLHRVLRAAARHSSLLLAVARLRKSRDRNVAGPAEGTPL